MSASEKLAMVEASMAQNNTSKEDNNMSVEQNVAEATQETAPQTEGAKAKKGSNPQAEAFKLEGKRIRDGYDAQTKAILGSKRDKVEFVAAIANPLKKQTRVEKNAPIDSFQIVGYQFRVLEDMDYSFAPLKPEHNGLLDVEKPITKVAKAGEIISLNIAETALFLAKPELDGKTTGGQKPVVIILKFSKFQSGSDSGRPLPALKLDQQQGSVKEVLVDVADKITDANGKVIGKVKPEFEPNFGNLYSVKKRGKIGGGKTSAPKVTNEGNIAAAFKAYLQKNLQ